MPDINETLKERAKTHGSFMDNASISQYLKGGVVHLNDWLKLEADQCEAIEVIFQKISRILSGDHNHIDSWHDISGYATLVEKRLVAEAESKRLDEEAL